MITQRRFLTPTLRHLAVAMALSLGTLGAAQAQDTTPMQQAPMTHSMQPAPMNSDMQAPMDTMQKADPMVGGAAMSRQMDIVSNASKSKDHTTLVAAVKAAGLVSTLQSAGPFTVFAPTNEAFDALPAGTVDTLLKPENKAQLKDILTYHVVAGRMDSAALKAKAEQQGGDVQLTTVEGQPLTVGYHDGNWTVTDAKGNVADITIADVYQSNGVIFVIDKVLMPEAMAQ